MKDKIVEETRKLRQAYLDECNNDLVALYEDLKRQEEKSNRIYYSFSPKASKLHHQQE